MDNFGIDFVEVGFLFQNSFHSLLKHRKNLTFMTLNAPTDYYRTPCIHRKSCVKSEWAAAVKSVGHQHQLFA